MSEWKATASNGFVRGVRLSKRGPERVQRRAIQGVVRRFQDGKEEVKGCGHAHQKRSCALKCAESWARHLNKTGETP
jgi:hypothetical protein